LQQAAQLVVSVGYGLALTVSLLDQVAHRIVIVEFRCARRERRLGDPAKSVIRKRGAVVVRVLDAGQVVFRVVHVRGDVAGSGRIGDSGQPVRVVVRVGCRLTVLVRHRRSAAPIVVGEARGACAAGIRDGLQSVACVIGKLSQVVHRIRDRRAISVGVVYIRGDVLLRIRDGINQPRGVIGELGNVAKRVRNLRQLTQRIIEELRRARGSGAVRRRRGDGKNITVGIVRIGRHVA